MIIKFNREISTERHFLFNIMFLTNGLQDIYRRREKKDKYNYRIMNYLKYYEIIMKQNMNYEIPSVHILVVQYSI